MGHWSISSIHLHREKKDARLGRQGEPQLLELVRLTKTLNGTIVQQATNIRPEKNSD